MVLPSPQMGPGELRASRAEWEPGQGQAVLPRLPGEQQRLAGLVTEARSTSRAVHLEQELPAQGERSSSLPVLPEVPTEPVD